MTVEAEETFETLGHLCLHITCTTKECLFLSEETTGSSNSAE